MLDRVRGKAQLAGTAAFRLGRYVLVGSFILAGIEVSSAAAPSDDPVPLNASSGTTAISGRIVDAQGLPLASVRVIDNATSTLTDAQGRFLLAPVMAGKSVVQIDARRVGANAPVDYGVYEVLGQATAAQTTQLGFVNALAPIDHTHDVTIPSPTTAETIVTTPAIPGLELHIPAGMVIRDAQGDAVTQIGITAVSPKHTPYPMPGSVTIPFAYTIQPSGACLYDAKGGIGYAWIVYPNVFHHLPRARETFWTYEPDRDGWRIYGAGQVSTDGSQVIPDRNTVITDFYSAECIAKTRSHLLKIGNPLPRPGATP